MVARTIVIIGFNISIVMASWSEGAIVKGIRFTGNRIFSSQQLWESMNTKVGSVFLLPVISRDLTAIMSHYNERGYYFAEVKLDTLIYSADSSALEIGISIHEGIEIIVGEIRITGNSAMTEKEILEKFLTRIGSLLLPRVLEEDIDNLLSSYGTRGFPFAEVEVKDISLMGGRNDGQVSLVIGVAEGKKVTIDEIKVEGNTSTDDNVVIRESRIKLHEIYNSKKIGRISNRLQRLNIFTHVEEPEVYSTSFGGGLVIKVVEGKTSTFNGILGYVPSAAGTGTVTGMIDIGMRNLFGTGRKFQIRWSKDERKSQDIRISYVEPWILDFPLNAAFTFDQRQQDTTYVRRGIRIQADLLFNESLTLSGVFGQQSVIPSDNMTRLTRSSAIMAGMEIGYDTRDRIFNPLQGVAYVTQYNLERKKTGVERSTLQRLSVDLDIFVRTFSMQVLYFGLHGKTLSGSGTEISDLYRFGGTNTFRGYRENQFIGKDIAWTNMEYRLVLAVRSYLYGFFDTGYYLLPAYESAGYSSSRDYLSGYGGGIRFETAIGNIGVSFGFGEGDSFFEGKVHIGIINEF